MNSSVQIRVKEGRLFRRMVKTRFSFRFGKASMTEMPIITLHLILETKTGEKLSGVSASGIPPLWFDKRPGKTPTDNEVDLMQSLFIADQNYRAIGLGTAFGLHRAITEPLRHQLTSVGIAPLAAGFGPSLYDAAIVDGLCRFHQQNFSTAIKNGLLGLSAADSSVLPVTPSERMQLRHTVGLADPLFTSDLQNPLNDGLPESLEQVVETYGASFYKVKISANLQETLPRLIQIAEILDNADNRHNNHSDNSAPVNYSVTLDGNEQFNSMESFADFFERIRMEPKLKNFLNRILWIEQPVLRDFALESNISKTITKITKYKPLIIDESDGEADALDRALALGYTGVSSKTCKGLFRSISHYIRLKREEKLQSQKAWMTGTGSVPEYILSSEDLTTVPILPLQQDLCLAAALGIEHTERNGHHYIHGFDFLSEEERDHALTQYPSLYEAITKVGTSSTANSLSISSSSANRSSARVSIRQGGFDLKEVNAALGFGSSSWPNWSSMDALESQSQSPSALEIKSTSQSFSDTGAASSNSIQSRSP